MSDLFVGLLTTVSFLPIVMCRPPIAGGGLWTGRTALQSNDRTAVAGATASWAETIQARVAGQLVTLGLQVAAIVVVG